MGGGALKGVVVEGKGRKQWPEDPCREKERWGDGGWVSGGVGGGQPKELEWEDREIERGK